MVGLLSLTNTAKIVRHHITLKVVTVDDVISRSGGVYALSASHHRNGINGGHCFYVASNIFTAFFVFTVRAE
jgi:hypothetical protein